MHIIRDPTIVSITVGTSRRQRLWYDAIDASLYLMSSFYTKNSKLPKKKVVDGIAKMCWKHSHSGIRMGETRKNMRFHTSRSMHSFHAERP